MEYFICFFSAFMSTSSFSYLCQLFISHHNEFTALITCQKEEIDQVQCAISVCCSSADERHVSAAYMTLPLPTVNCGQVLQAHSIVCLCATTDNGVTGNLAFINKFGKDNQTVIFKLHPSGKSIFCT